MSNIKLTDQSIDSTKAQALDRVIFPVLLTARFKRQATELSELAESPAKRAQIYYNTLAVLATDFYCQCVGIPSDLKASKSFDRLQILLNNTADLFLPNLGKIECVPYVDNHPVNGEIKLSNQRDICGYIAVKIDLENNQANLMGFLPSLGVETMEIELTKWRSLADFLVWIKQIQTKPLVQLSQWLKNIFSTGWEEVTDLINVTELQPVWHFRSMAQRRKESLPPMQPAIARGKRLTIDAYQIGLYIGLLERQSPDIDVWVSVTALNDQHQLPYDLELMVIDDKGMTVMQAMARESREVQLEFSCAFGEQFSVKLALGDVNLIEDFCM